MYYAILNYGAKGPVPTGKDIHLFFEQTGRHCSDLCVELRPCGWGIQYCGYRGLKERVPAEEKRLKEMKEEMDQIHEIVRRNMDRYHIGQKGPPKSTAERVANVAGELKARSRDICGYRCITAVGQAQLAVERLDTWVSIIFTLLCQIWRIGVCGIEKGGSRFLDILSTPTGKLRCQSSLIGMKTHARVFFAKIIS